MGESPHKETPDTETLARRIHETWDVSVFPVGMFWDEGKRKWQKKPLVRWGSLTGIAKDRWNEADAVGVPMGRRSGLIAIDLDDYKGREPQKWLEKHGSPVTRMHGTASGGRHLIFELLNELDLGNHAPAVDGLDVRGNGGYIVWADVLGLYSVVDDRAPAPLPKSIADELLALKAERAATRLDNRDVPEWRPPDSATVERKLNRSLLKVEDTRFRQRWQGNTAGMRDKSRSAMDMSIASLLAQRGFDYHEIVLVLLGAFEHGTAARDGQTDDVLRSVMRCAARAVEQKCEKTAMRVELARKLLATRPTNGTGQ